MDTSESAVAAASTWSLWEHRATQTNDPNDEPFPVHDPSEPWHTLSGYVIGSRDEAKALREVHHRIRQFAALLPLYVEAPETFDFVTEWVGPSLPPSQADAFRQQEEDENALIAALKGQLDAKLNDPSLPPEAKVAFLQEVGSRQKMLFLRRTKRLEESKKLQVERCRSAFARMMTATVEDDEVESDLWLSVETLVKSSIGYLSKIFVFLRSAMERQALPSGASCAALFPGGERQRTFYGLTGGLHPQLDAVLFPRDFEALRSIVKGAELPDLYRLKYSEPWNFGVSELEALRERFLKQYAAEEHRKIDARVKQMRADALSAAEKDMQRTAARLAASQQQRPSSSGNVGDSADSEAPRNPRRSPPPSAQSQQAVTGTVVQPPTMDSLPSRGGSAGKPPLASSALLSSSMVAGASTEAAAGRLPSLPPRPSSSGAASSSALSSARGDTSSDDALVSSALLRATIGSNVSPNANDDPLEPFSHSVMNRDERSMSTSSAVGVELGDKRVGGRVATELRLSPRGDESVRGDAPATGVHRTASGGEALHRRATRTSHPIDADGPVVPEASAPSQAVVTVTSSKATAAAKTVTVAVPQPRQQYHGNMFHGLQEAVAREAAQTATVAQASWAAAATLVHAKRQLANVAGSLEERAAQRAAGRRGTLPATSTHASAASEPPLLPSPLSEPLEAAPAHDANAFDASWRKTEDGRRELVVSPLRHGVGGTPGPSTTPNDAAAPPKPHREAKTTSPTKRCGAAGGVSRASRGPPSALTGPLADLAAKLQHQREIDAPLSRGAEHAGDASSHLAAGNRGRGKLAGSRSTSVALQDDEHCTGPQNDASAESGGMLRQNLSALLAPIRRVSSEELADHTVATTTSEQLMVEAMIHSRLQRLHLDRRGGASGNAEAPAASSSLVAPTEPRVAAVPAIPQVRVSATGAALESLPQQQPTTPDAALETFAADVPTARRTVGSSDDGAVRGTAATAVPSLTQPSRRYQMHSLVGSASSGSRKAATRRGSSGPQSASTSTAHARAPVITTTTTLGAPTPVAHCSVRNAFAAQPLPSLAAHYYQPSPHTALEDGVDGDGSDGAAQQGVRKGGGVVVHSATTATFADHVAKTRLQQLQQHNPSRNESTDDLPLPLPERSSSDPVAPQSRVVADDHEWVEAGHTAALRGPQPFPASQVRRGQNGGPHDWDHRGEDHGNSCSGLWTHSTSRREDLNALMRDTVHTVVALDHATMRIAVPKPSFSYLT